MKCKFCGAPLSLEDERCPFCGEINEQAAKHVADMKHYEKEFTRTKGWVFHRVHRMGTKVEHAILLGILIVLNLAVIVGRLGAYDIRFWLDELSVKRNEKTYYSQLSQYEEQEDFRRLNAWYMDKNMWDSELLREFSAVSGAAYAYEKIYQNVIWLSDDGIEELYYEDGEMVEDLAEGLQELQEVVEECTSENKYDYFPDRFEGSHKEAVLQMKEQSDALLQTYCGLSEEDITELEELSQQEKMLVIGTRMGVYGKRD